MATTKKSGSRGTTHSSGRRQVEGAGQATTDHEEIRRWVEDRGGHPACVKGTGGRGDPGLLRIDLPGYAGPKLRPISWDEFFEKFDENGLAFVYQDKTRTGRPSRFNKLVNRQAGGEAHKPRQGRHGRS